MAFDGPRTLLILSLIFFFFLSPDTRAPSLVRLLEIEVKIEEERAALEILNATDYNALDAPHSRWINLTGLREQDGFGWQMLPKVQERARQQCQHAIYSAPLSARNKTESIGLDEQRQSEVQAKTIDSINPFHGRLPMYSNVTSILQGKWVRSVIDNDAPNVNVNLTSLVPNVTYATTHFGRNITGFEGDIRVKLTEQSIDEERDLDSGLIRKIKAEMVIKDDTSSGDGWDMTMFGVHFVRQGGIVLTTTSEKFEGIFALPHFTRSAEAFAKSKSLVMKSLEKVIDKQKILPEATLSPWSSTPGGPSENGFPTPHCELVAYLQQQPSNAPDIHFQAIEDELRYPTGASIHDIPQIHMSAVIFSPDCGFVIESKGPPDYPPTTRSHLKGRKIEAYMNEARKIILFFAMLVFSGVILLKQQMHEASTPSTKSRVSFYTVVIMALGDGFAGMSLLVVGMLVDVLFLPLVTIAFFFLVCVSFFSMKFLVEIWKVQAPERQERERERQRVRDQRAAAIAVDQAPASTAIGDTSSPNEETENPPDGGLLPLPATARRSNRPSTPVIITPDQDLEAAETEDAAVGPPANNQIQAVAATAVQSARAEIGALYSRFYFILMGFVFLSVYATSWPTTVRSLYCNGVSFVYLSLWVPQIYRNVMRNCRKALSWRFIIGGSLLRLAPFLYFYTWDENVLFVNTDVHAFLVLAGWVWIQIFVLATQDAVGPRIFVPETWVPKAYDYHPVLREGDTESGGNMPVGFTEAIASPTSPVATTSAAASQTPTSNTSAKKTKEHNKRTFDCAICTDDFEVPVVPSRAAEDESKAVATAATTIFARRAYMVTPCRHIFHTSCLEGWMRYRLQCPICREVLPPL